MPVPKRSAVTGRLPKIAAALETWFPKNQRPLPWRASYRPYHIWISEVMLQQTRMEVAVAYFERFIDRFPDIRALAKADVEEVLAIWSGLGYYRRARMLHAGAIQVVERHGGELPQSIESLLAIPGIGRYTAGAIASIAYDEAAPIVDGNVARLLARVAALEAPSGSSALSREEWNLASSLVSSAASPRVLNQALMELGALVCTPTRPRCELCPLVSWCEAFRRGEQERFPVAGPPKASRSLRIPIYIVEDPHGRVLMRIVQGRLMGGMFHLPHGNDALLPGGHGENFRAGKLLGTFRHSVTDRRIEFSAYLAELDSSSIGESADEWTWVDPRELGSLPHPSYVRKALRLLRGEGEG